MITYIDKEAIYDIDNYDVALIPMNITYDFSNGLLYRLSNKCPELVSADESTNFADTRKLGKRLNVGKYSLMYVFRPTKRMDKESLDYEALENALKTANNEFYGKKVITTMVYGTKHVANRDEQHIKKILEENNDKIDLYVYTQKERKKVYERKEIERIYKNDKEKIEKELEQRFLK